MADIKFVGLGGLDEKGRNMYVVEIDNDIFVFDAGHKFPLTKTFGVDLIIPNTEYLVKNIKRIKGIFISHGHEDQIGALPYFMKNFKDIPIYATWLTAEAIKLEFVKAKINEYNVVEIAKDKDFMIGDVMVRPFPLTHTWPDHVGYALKKGNEQVVYATDFIIDPSLKWEEYETGFSRMRTIIKEANTKMMLVESVGAGSKGFVAPGHSIKSYAQDAITKAEHRVIIGAFEQKIFQLKEMIEVAISCSRKIVIYGRTIAMLIEKMEKKGMIKIPAHLKVPFNEMNDHENAVVFVLGTPQRLYAKLGKIALGEDEFLKLRRTDTVLITAAAIPGYEVAFAQILDDFYKVDIPAKGLKRKNVSSAHAAKEDLKMLINMFRPECIIPIKGEYRHQVEVAKIAKEMGYEDSKVPLVRAGKVYSFVNGKIALTKNEVPVTDVLVDGLGVGDIGAIVINDRAAMANDGIIVMGYTLQRGTRKIIGGPDIQMRGFLFVGKESKPISDWLVNMFKEELQQSIDSGNFDWNEVKESVKKKANKYLFKETGKKPIVLPVIMEVQA